MSEDEAFIRAIVNNPGDDTPRLVYADWLDDRDDPRGPYLRAEHAWAATHDPGDRDREVLSQMAKALDPVWVARVSRPPVGVCCEELRFDAAKPILTTEQISQFENQLGLPIPPEYRAFLLNYNGGSPELAPPEGIRWRCSNWLYSLGLSGGEGEQRCLFRQTLLAVERLRVCDLYELWDAQPGDVPWRNDVLPIGESGDFQLFLAVRGKYAGRLHLHDWTGELCRFGFIGFAPTLPEYLAHLPAGSCGIANSYPSTPLQSFWNT